MLCPHLFHHRYFTACVALDCFALLHSCFVCSRSCIITPWAHDGHRQLSVGSVQIGQISQCYLRAPSSTGPLLAYHCWLSVALFCPDKCTIITFDICNSLTPTVITKQAKQTHRNTLYLMPYYSFILGLYKCITKLQECIEITQTR